MVRVFYTLVCLLNCSLLDLVELIPLTNTFANKEQHDAMWDCI